MKHFLTLIALCSVINTGIIFSAEKSLSVENMLYEEIKYNSDYTPYGIKYITNTTFAINNAFILKIEESDFDSNKMESWKMFPEDGPVVALNISTKSLYYSDKTFKTFDNMPHMPSIAVCIPDKHFFSYGDDEKTQQESIIRYQFNPRSTQYEYISPIGFAPGIFCLAMAINEKNNLLSFITQSITQEQKISFLSLDSNAIEKDMPCDLEKQGMYNSLFSPDGSRLFVSDGKKILIINLPEYTYENKPLLTMATDNNNTNYGIRDLQFYTPTILALLIKDISSSRIEYWDLIERQKIGSTHVFENYDISSFCLSPNKKEIAITGRGLGYPRCLKMGVPLNVRIHSAYTLWIRLKQIQSSLALPQDIIRHCTNLFMKPL
jgi:hypothetical protein